MTVKLPWPSLPESLHMVQDNLDAIAQAVPDGDSQVVSAMGSLLRVAGPFVADLPPIPAASHIDQDFAHNLNIPVAQQYPAGLVVNAAGMIPFAQPLDSNTLRVGIFNTTTATNNAQVRVLLFYT